MSEKREVPALPGAQWGPEPEEHGGPVWLAISSSGEAMVTSTNWINPGWVVSLSGAQSFKRAWLAERSRAEAAEQRVRDLGAAAERARTKLTAVHASKAWMPSDEMDRVEDALAALSRAPSEPEPSPEEMAEKLHPTLSVDYLTDVAKRIGVSAARNMDIASQHDRAVALAAIRTERARRGGQ